MSILRNPVLYILAGILLFGWYQDNKINKLMVVADKQVNDIRKLETSLSTANDNLEIMVERITIQSELIDDSIAANKDLDNEYKNYIDTKFTASGGMLLNIQRTVRDLSGTTGTPGSATNGSTGPIYIELPPEMGRDILGLLRDADSDRLETIQWKSWYCKHNPKFSKCEGWFP